MEIGTVIISGLTMGFLSGFHCIGMCGPIALSMGLTKTQKVNYYLQNLTYQFGRITTYTILGSILGIVGKGFQMAGIQQALTIGTGIILILMALFSFGGKDFASKIPFLSKALLKVKMSLAKILQKSDVPSRYITGVLNGLLPCGMVYAALTAALAAGSISKSALFMTSFGLGTFPFMFAVVILGNLVTNSFRFKILKLVPVMMMVLGGLFILRGMEVGIPYLSPKSDAMHITTEQNKDKPACCH